MGKERSLFERIFFSDPCRAEREERILRYVIHRINEDADLHEVLREDYVKRNCSQAEIDEIHNNPELVHTAREHLEQTIHSAELNPWQGSR